MATIASLIKRVRVGTIVASDLNFGARWQYVVISRCQKYKLEIFGPLGHPGADISQVRRQWLVRWPYDLTARKKRV